MCLDSIPLERVELSDTKSTQKKSISLEHLKKTSFLVPGQPRIVKTRTTKRICLSVEKTMVVYKSLVFIAE